MVVWSGAVCARFRIPRGAAVAQQIALRAGTQQRLGEEGGPEAIAGPAEVMAHAGE
jgi:hypothetical protein